MKTENGGCPPDCGHSEAEHAAFDRGVKDGEAKGYDAECPAEYRSTDLEETWEIGRSVNARAATNPVRDQIADCYR